MRSLAAVLAELWRQARWQRRGIDWVRRHGQVLRVIGAALAALGLLSVAIFVDEEPVWAQEAESTGVGISLGDLSNYPTHLTVDGFMVELANLTATEEYKVVVSSDNSARLGIGGCGTASQTATVTGVETEEVRFLVYACAVGAATVTAEVRRTGASSPEATISQQLMVEALPDVLIRADGTSVRAPAPAPGAVPKAGTPGSVPNTHFREDEITSTSARARWETPSNGGTPLTGFGVLFWQKDNPVHPGYDDPLVLGSDVRSRNFPNLQPGTTYNFQIHACNGEDSCGYWTWPIVEVTTLPATGRPAKPHTIGFDEPAAGDTSLTLRWSADADTGGRPLTRFQLMRRQVPGSWPPLAEAATVGASVRRHEFSGLNTGITYRMRIRACNGDNDDTDCSDWAESRDQTVPQPPEVSVTDHDLGTGPVMDPKDACGDNPETRWGPPQAVEVIPWLQRKVVLCWSPVELATEYIINVEIFGSTMPPVPSDRVYPLIGISMDISGETWHVFDIDALVKVTGSSQGLVENPGYRITVVAANSSTSMHSSTIILIDSPITIANGASDSIGSGQVALTWTDIGDATILADSDYTRNGKHFLRIRKSTDDTPPVAIDHTLAGWKPTTLDAPITPYPSTAPDRTTSTVGRLDKYHIYAIQLIKEKTGPMNDMTVFSARYAYVWPSDRPANGGERVATFPLTQRLANKTYYYRICDTMFDIEEDFKPGRKGEWITLIGKAFDQWQAAAPPLNLTLSRDLRPCTDYGPVIRIIVDKVRQLLMDKPGDLVDDLKSYLTTERTVESVTGRLIDSKIAEDRRLNEIKLFDYPVGPSQDLYEYGVFPQISTYIGLSGNCWKPYQYFGQPDPKPRGRMCTISSDGETLFGNPVITSDIHIRANAYRGHNVALPAGNARSNKCRDMHADETNSPYQDFFHEVAHVLGIGGGAEEDAAGVAWSSRGHPHSSVRDTIMGTARIPACSPYPLDLMALYALYQSQ